jgi:hypothetical protein
VNRALSISRLPRSCQASRGKKPMVAAATTECSLACYWGIEDLKTFPAGGFARNMSAVESRLTMAKIVNATA